MSDGDVVTAGGRVLAVTASAATLKDALKAVYLGVEQVDFEGKTFRRDIAHRWAHCRFKRCHSLTFILNAALYPARLKRHLA